jgi:uncharacterized protein DUF6653
MSTASANRESSGRPRLVEARKGTWERRLARLFGLEGDRWMRHANPLSVWTRFSCLSLIALAIWSREWLGWFAVIPLVLSVGWVFLNPLFFDDPRSTRNWASRGVLGERIWADRDAVDVPGQFRSRVPAIANAFSAIGLILLAYGLVVLSVLPAIAGLLMVAGGKAWYIDRMALLFDHMKERRLEYARWDY